MKPTLKDYLSIALALLAIFLSGYGIGFLLGERKGLQQAAPPPLPPPAKTSSIADWEALTLETIQKSIELSPEQLEKVKAEIAKSGAGIQAAREAYRAEFRDLNERLKPHLTPEQLDQLPGASPD